MINQIKQTFSDFSPSSFFAFFSSLLSPSSFLLVTLLSSAFLFPLPQSPSPYLSLPLSSPSSSSCPFLLLLAASSSRHFLFLASSSCVCLPPSSCCLFLHFPRLFLLLLHLAFFFSSPPSPGRLFLIRP